MAKLTRYWHGGVPGLKVGDRIRPAASLRVLPVHYALDRGTDYPSDPTRVYVTTDRQAARYYAASYIDGVEPLAGDVYNVRPRGELRIDEDLPTGKHFSCASAVVVAVVERGVRMTDAALRAGSRGSTWSDGRAMYDAAGLMMPSPEMESLGITAEDLAPLGPGADYESAIIRVQVLMDERGIDLPTH